MTQRPGADDERAIFTSTDRRTEIINRRVQMRYDELMREGKHGHYETLFRVVHEELTRCANESYTRGMVDQRYEPLPDEAIARLKDSLNADRAETVIGRQLGDKS